MAKVEEKQPVVKEISAKIDGAASAVIVDARGLTVTEDTALRKALREAGVEYKVYKNTMMKIAFNGTDFAQLDPYLNGPSALAVSKDDATAAARVIAKFQKTSDKLQEFGDKGSAKVEEVWNKLGESGTVDDIREAFVTGTAKLMTLWDKLEKSGKIDEVKDTVEKVAKKAAGTAKGIAKEASERAEKADADFAADADKAAEEEFKDEEI